MQNRPKNRKQQIIALGLDFLQTHGYENFSYQDISRELGITKASIHHHFPKKSDLGIALCEAIEEWHEHQFSELRHNQASALETLRSYMGQLATYVVGESRVCPLSSLQSDITLLPEAMYQAIKRLDQHEIDFIAEQLEQGREAGDLHFQGEAENQALIVVLSCKGALQYARIHGDKVFSDTVKQLLSSMKQ